MLCRVASVIFVAFFNLLSRPPVHLLCLESCAVHTEVRILKQFLLHKRSQWSRPCDARVGKDVRPRSQKLIVHVIHDTVEVKSSKCTDKLALETGLDLENVADDGCYGPLARRALIHNVEDGNLAHASLVPL
ncbi:hypothetical protein HG530_012737 [Fusarium avenaceum]|nr:hypothetical protein HG530_012737 [Fusarium avenaceum]